VWRRNWGEQKWQGKRPTKTRRYTTSTSNHREKYGVEDRRAEAKAYQHDHRRGEGDDDAKKGGSAQSVLHRSHDEPRTSFAHPLCELSLGSSRRTYTNFRECPKGEVRRIPLLRTPVNKGKRKEGRGAMLRPLRYRNGTPRLITL
jgi:hypothetical protein